MGREPTAAEALFPHLPHRTDDKRQDKTTFQPRNPMAEALYPKLAAVSKPPALKTRNALTKIGTTEAATYGAGYEAYQMALRQWRR
jgi:hypothetical protein